MAALHSALQTLSPTSFSSVPLDEPLLKDYLQDAFFQSQALIDSVPPPSIDDSSLATRSRASTGASTASSVSEMSVSSARPDPPSPLHAVLQKEWGKPIKLAAKDNPLAMAVYKLNGKDGKGAWFARRSVHEGMGFKKWKMGLQREFPESLEVQGGPGEGNVRGIGGERRVERIGVKGVGMAEVYHLSAQFPGPTAPRDFVTLLLTSSSAIPDPSSSLSVPDYSPTQGRPKPARFIGNPRHFMVISKPCIHPDCPPRDGFIRGQYESIEFIREIPQKPTKSSSTSDLLKSMRARSASPPLGKEALLRNAQKTLQSLENSHTGESDAQLVDSIQAESQLSPAVAEEIVSEARKRGKTISFAESRGRRAKGEAMDTPEPDFDDEAELNPVEWIMITRSDPGGSVPRWLVERGTPSSIVADASKFLDWACKKEHPESDEEVEDVKDDEIRQPLAKHQRTNSLEAYQTNGHLAGLENGRESVETSEETSPDTQTSGNIGAVSQQNNSGLLTNVTNAAVAGFESYAPQAVIDRLPGHRQSPSSSSTAAMASDDSPSKISKSLNETSSIDSASSIMSFASAPEGPDGNIDDTLSIQSTASKTNPKDGVCLSWHEKELAKLNERKKKLDENLIRTREKEVKDKEELTSKEAERMKRAEEKHAREVQKQEEKYKREVAKLEAKRVKEAAKVEDRRKKMEDKDEKARLTREKEEVKQELEVVKRERDILREQVGALQKENTTLVASMGRLGGSKDALSEVKDEAADRTRRRSASLRERKITSMEGE